MENLLIGGQWEFYFMKWMLELIPLAMMIQWWYTKRFSKEKLNSLHFSIGKNKTQLNKKLNSNAKSLVKHLLDADLTKRYGNLKNGVGDIKNHRFFKTINWDNLLNRTITPPYLPKVK